MIDRIGGALSALAPAPASFGRTQDVQPAAGNFSSTLASVVGSAVDTLRQGEAAGIAGIQGQMSPQRVVEQVLAAERTLQAAIAVRDKLVGAYLEINRMQI